MLPGQKGIEEITCMGPPTTYTGIRKFIGAVGYFRHFIKNFARIAKPLNDLLGCGNSKLKNHPVSLTAAAEEAFHTLKKKCATAPVLAFADLKKPFLQETDASKYGLGAVLQQVQGDGRYHLVVYVSHALRGSEANYHSSKVEFLALKWAVTQQFKEYLMYQPFTIQTDNNPLMYMLMTPNLDATRHRWVSALAGFKKDAMNEIMERACFSHIPHTETDNPALVAKHEEFEEELNVQVAAMVMEKHIKHNLMGLDWKSLQENDPIIQHVLKWKCRNNDKGAKKDKNANRCTLEQHLLTGSQLAQC